MAAIHDALRASGIWDGGEVRPAIRAAYGRVARELRRRAVWTVGLLPAGDDVAVPAVAIELARALVYAGGSTAAVLDPLGRWAGVTGGDAAPGSEDWYATEWLADRVAVLSPITADRSTALPLVRKVLRDAPRSFLNVVVDLTGFARIGEDEAAGELLDGVAVVARSGRTRSAELARVLGRLEAPRALGVVLSGA